jgi:hypothetical protein
VALDCNTRTVRSAAYSGTDVGVHAGHDDAAARGQLDHDSALLVQAAARTIHVPEVDADYFDVAAETGQRQSEPLLEVGPQVIGDFHATASYL